MAIITINPIQDTPRNRRRGLIISRVPVKISTTNPHVLPWAAVGDSDGDDPLGQTCCIPKDKLPR